MNRADILALASQYVTKDRNTSYDEPEDNFHRIAALWEAWDRIKQPGFPPEVDVAVKMALMKLGRMAFDWRNQDTHADALGYLACGAEIALKEHP